MATTSTTGFSSQRQVTYRCGSCGYDLNLSSTYRNTKNIDTKYGKAIRRGVVSFFAVNDSRFSRVDDLSCVPYRSNLLFGFLSRRTKLVCRKCGKFIGIDYNDGKTNKFEIKISALQPSGSL